MSDALQIRRCSGALQAKHSYPLPSFLQPSPARRLNPKISNREKEAPFFGPSTGGCFSPPAVRSRLRRRVPPPKIQNGEKEPPFSAPSRGGSLTPPAVRSRLRRRVPPPKIQIQQVSSLKIS